MLEDKQFQDPCAFSNLQERLLSLITAFTSATPTLCLVLVSRLEADIVVFSCKSGGEMTLLVQSPPRNEAWLLVKSVCSFKVFFIL